MLEVGGGMWPSSLWRRRLLNHSTQARVASSTCSTLRHGPWRRISSVLYKPLTDSARLLSYESPIEPMDGRAPI